MTVNALQKALRLVSGGNQTHFAHKVNEQVALINQGSNLLSRPIPNLSQQLVHYWLKNDVPCAAHYAPIISNLTGGKVSMHELRPDVYPQEKAA